MIFCVYVLSECTEWGDAVSELSVQTVTEFGTSYTQCASKSLSNNDSFIYFYRSLCLQTSVIGYHLHSYQSVTMVYMYLCTSCKPNNNVRRANERDDYRPHWQICRILCAYRELGYKQVIINKTELLRYFVYLNHINTMVYGEGVLRVKYTQVHTNLLLEITNIDY